MAVTHSENLSFGGVMDTMRRGATGTVCRSSNGDFPARESYRMRLTTESGGNTSILVAEIELNLINGKNDSIFMVPY